MRCMYGSLECHQNRFLCTFNCHWQINNLVSLNWLQCFQMACAHYQCEMNIGRTTWSFLHPSVKSHLVLSILELAELIWDSSQGNMSTTIKANVTTKPLSEHCDLKGYQTQVHSHFYKGLQVHLRHVESPSTEPHQEALETTQHHSATRHCHQDFCPTTSASRLVSKMTVQPLEDRRITGTWSPVTFMYWIMNSLAERTLTAYGKCSLPGSVKQTPHLPVYSQHTCSFFFTTVTSACRHPYSLQIIVKALGVAHSINYFDALTWF